MMSRAFAIITCSLSLLILACGGASTGPAMDNLAPEGMDDAVSETLLEDTSLPDTQVPVDVDITPEVTTDAKPECEKAEECDDNNACTNDMCVSGKCVHEIIEDCRTCNSNEECKDGNGCTEDICEKGVCKWVLIEGACVDCETTQKCDDGNECTKDVCTDKGICEFTCQCNALCNKDADCYTGDLCAPATCETVKGKPGCVEMQCVKHPKVCDDNNPCTQDWCDGAVGECKHVKIPGCGVCDGDGDCTDSDLCTIDLCDLSTHLCIHVPDPCDDGNPKTIDYCSPSIGCQHLKMTCENDGDCDDGNLCTIDTCDVTTSSCKASPVNCDDGLDCTFDFCLPTVGCVHNLVGTPCQGAEDCDDSDPCTEDICDPSGCCIHSQVLNCRPCEVATDCDDGNPCTDDVCDEETKTCSYEFNTVPCDDNDLCTEEDRCNMGKCVGGVFVVCKDDNPCTIDTCNAESGCVFTPIQDCVLCGTDLECDDFNLCTKDWCDLVEGVCRRLPISCDDANPCTDDTCNPATGCGHTPNNALCEDGDNCTLGDRCDGGICVSGTGVPNCNDYNDCTADSCDPKYGCVFKPISGECDDKDPCTIGDHCEAGKCVPSSLMDCSDGNECTKDWCQAGYGCKHEAIVCNDNDPCTTDSCDVTKGCVFLPKTCDDSNACTKDFCLNGECVFETISCDDGNTCTDDSCDPAVGCVNTANNNPCSDGNVCTVADVCVDKVCVPGPALDCDDKNPCTDDWCDPIEGCKHEFNSAPCEDGDLCTSGDTCMEGKCVPGGPTDCDDNEVCTDDICDPTAGCIHVNNTNPCEDGNACTEGDFCSGGKCVPGAQVVCQDDGNVCTDEKCDPILGCIHVNNTNPCPNANECVVDSRCKDGQCVGKPRDCEDGNTCTIDTCVPGLGCYHGNYQPPDTPCTDSNNKCLAIGHCLLNGSCVMDKQVNCDDGLACTNDYCDPLTGCYHTLRSNCPCQNDSDCAIKVPPTVTCCRWDWWSFRNECFQGNACN